jgi:hypothetical protein
MPIPGFLTPNVRPELATPPHLTQARHANIDKEPNRFPMADVLWTLAMACDVFLIVFYYYDAEALRKLEMKYIIAITTLVSIPAVTFLFIHTPDRGPMYGSVTVSALPLN